MTAPTRRSLVILGAVGLWRPALAHGFHAAFTVIESNLRTGALEIIHRIFLQDLEVLVKARSNARVGMDDVPALEKTLKSYLGEVFTVADDRGKPLTTAWVGMKLTADTVLIYQEIAGAAAVKSITVGSQILTETHPGQVNTVNVSLGGDTQTVVFMAGDPPQTVRF